jgi:hypothetical protein
MGKVRDLLYTARAAKKSSIRFMWGVEDVTVKSREYLNSCRCHFWRRIVDKMYGEASDNESVTGQVLMPRYQDVKHAMDKFEDERRQEESPNTIYLIVGNK